MQRALRRCFGSLRLGVLREELERLEAEHLPPPVSSILAGTLGDFWWLVFTFDGEGLPAA